MNLDTKIRKIALEDKNVGLLHGKMGACIYLYTVSDHDETSCAYQTAKELLAQIAKQLSSVKSIELDKGLIGLSLGFSYLIQNKYLQDSTGEWIDAIDAYIYKVVMRTTETDLRGKELLSLVDALYYAIFRYKRLKNRYSKELCLRLIKYLLNIIYMKRPADFYSEAIPFKIHNQLLVYLFCLLEIRKLEICVDRIDRIFKEMQPFLFALQPILQPNRYCLSLVASLIAEVTGNEDWKNYADRMMSSVDMFNLYNTDLYEMNILLNNGVLGITLLACLYNSMSNESIPVNTQCAVNRIKKSSFWQRFENDGVFAKKYYSIDGYCGIKLFMNLVEKQNI